LIGSLHLFYCPTISFAYYLTFNIMLLIFSALFLFSFYLNLLSLSFACWAEIRQAVLQQFSLWLRFTNSWIYYWCLL
jgi:hypothetical protein